MTVERETSPFEILACSVSNHVGSRVPIAACKAGFQGLLDLEYADPASPRVRAAVAEFRDAAPGQWG